jgi:hypothetical protein
MILWQFEVERDLVFDARGDGEGLVVVMTLMGVMAGLGLCYVFLGMCGWLKAK